MKIIPTAEECSDIIIGTYGGSSFYNTFDKVLYSNDSKFIDAPIDDSKIEKINKIITKIQSHWNKQNSIDFRRFIKNNINITNALIKYPEANYNKFIMSFNIRGVQNTKISKILHIFKPDIFPMLDPIQGKFLLESYNKNSREHLILAIEAFNKYHNDKDNVKKTKQIAKTLVSLYGINISVLRVSEFLLWIQTQLSIKNITKVVIKRAE